LSFRGTSDRAAKKKRPTPKGTKRGPQDNKPGHWGETRHFSIGEPIALIMPCAGISSDQ
jgi:hypothetical protein